MGTLPDWKAEDSQWDRLYLDGLLVPGIARLDIDASRAAKIEKSKDRNGTSISDDGYEGAKIKGEIRMWTASQADEWHAMYPRFNPRTLDGPSTPLAIVHPIATLYNVVAIYAPKWSTKAPKSADEDLVVTFEALEWFPETKEKSAGGGAAPGGSPSGSGDGNVDPLSQKEAEDVLAATTDATPDPANAGPTFP